MNKKLDLFFEITRVACHMFLLYINIYVLLNLTETTSFATSWLIVITGTISIFCISYCLFCEIEKIISNLSQ